MQVFGIILLLNVFELERTEKKHFTKNVALLKSQRNVDAFEVSHNICWQLNDIYDCLSCSFPLECESFVNNGEDWLLSKLKCAKSPNEREMQKDRRHQNGRKLYSNELHHYQMHQNHYRNHCRLSGRMKRSAEYLLSSEHNGVSRKSTKTIFKISLIHCAVLASYFLQYTWILCSHVHALSSVHLCIECTLYNSVEFTV